MNSIKHKKVSVRFFRTASGGEPVREWLLSIAKEDRIAIGQDIKARRYAYLSGFMKKTQKTPKSELDLGRKRKREPKNG